MSTEVSEAVLMTAGLGTRLRPFTGLLSKALLPVMGIPVVQFVLDSLVTSGVQTVIANIHHLPEMTRKGLLALDGAKHRVQISDESGLLLGSAGAIREAVKRFKTDTFYYANGDVLCDLDWERLAAHHFRLREQHGVKLTLALFPESPIGENYREILFNPRTHQLTGLGAVRERCPFFIGAAVLNKEGCERIPPEGPADFVRDILEPAIRERKVGVYLGSGSWYDLGSPLLWFNTHRALIDRLEVGYFPSPVSRNWKRRIEQFNIRLGEKIWISRSSSRPKRISNWAAPCYWDGRGQISSVAPTLLGPDAFLYGNEPSGQYQPGHSGIGLEGLWTGF